MRLPLGGPRVVKDMNVDADGLTAPILGRADIESLRAAEPRTHARHRRDDRAGAVGWLALVVLGNLIVLAMLVLVVLWT